MAIAYVKEVAHSTTISGSAPTVSVTNAPAAGNLLVVSVGTSQTGGGPTLSSVTDSKGNTWHVDAVLTDASSTETVGVASTLQDAGALTTSDTITLHFSASVTVTHGAVVVDEFSGCTNTIDQTANGSHLSSTSRNAGTTAATTNANDLVWAAWAANGTETSFTPGAGYTAPTPAFYAPSKTSVEREYKIVAATGTQNPTATGASFSTIGVTVVYQAAASAVNSTLVASAGSVAITGSATTLPTARKLPGSAGAISITGMAATLPIARKFSGGAGSVAITGATTKLPIGRKLPLSPGSVVITGSPATPKTARFLPLGPGSIVISGAPATLTGPGARTLTLVASAGAIAITGASTKLPTARRMTASPAVYAITGASSTMRVAWRLVANPGAIALNGANATLVGPSGVVATVPDVPFIPLAIISHSI